MKKLFKSTLLLFCCLIALSSSSGATESARIISLVPSQTELLFHMGLGNLVVGTSDYCNYPEEARNRPRIGALELNIERIMSLRPTLLVDVNSMHKKYELLFAQLGLNYLNFTVTRLDQLPKMAEELTRIIGRPEKGLEFAMSWRKQTAEMTGQQSASMPKVYFEIWDTPLQAAGGSSYIGDMIKAAGGENILSDPVDFPVVNPETIIQANPDVIIIAYPLPDPISLETRPGWQNLRAVKNHQIHILDQDPFIRPGPRNIEALLQLKKIFDSASRR